MFDKYQIQAGPRSIDVRASITENRATTDKSVELLMEMEKAAVARLIGRDRLEDSTLDVRWWIFQNYASAELEIACRWKLNGEERRFNFKLDSYRLDCASSQLEKMRMIAGKVRERIIDELGLVMTVELFKQTSLGKGVPCCPPSTEGAG